MVSSCLPCLHIFADFSQLCCRLAVFRGEFWSVKFIEIRDFFRFVLLFQRAQNYERPKDRNKNRNRKSAIGLCTILLSCTVLM